MKIVFDRINDEAILEEEIEKIESIIPKLESSFKDNLSIYFEFLSKQEKNGNYIEIHWPLFEYNITLLLSKINEKCLISILNHKDSIVYGNLLIEGFSCLSNNELKKLGEWQGYSKKLKIFKLFQGALH